MKVKAKRGFSLIEIIISVALLAILLIPISNVIIGTTKKNKDAEINNKVTTEAQKVLEELNSYDTLTFDSHNNFTMLNGQMILHYDPVRDTISTVNPGTVTNSNDVINVSVSGIKDTTLTRASATPRTATTTFTAVATTTATVTPDLYITNDGFVQIEGAPKKTLTNMDNGVIANIKNDYTCEIYDNTNTKDSPVQGALLGTIPVKALNTFIVQLQKDPDKTPITKQIPILVYSDASNPIKFVVNYEYGISSNFRLEVDNIRVVSNVDVSYNKLPSSNPDDAMKVDQVYKFTVTAQAKSPLSTELDPAGNKVKKTLKFSGDTLKNIVLK